MTVHTPSRSNPSLLRPLGKDVVSALGFLALGLVLLALGVHPFEQYPVLWPATAEHLHWWHALPLALACAATCYQTRYPLMVYWVITGILVLDMTMSMHLAVLLVWANAVYNVARHTPGRVLRWSLVGFCLAIFVWLVAWTADLTAGLGGLLQIILFSIVSLWWGSEVRGGYERAEMERLKSLAARRREELERQELLRNQRADLAAQLHDTISSHLSTIALYTTGALDRSRQPEQDGKILQEIRHAALAALHQMRELIDVLRTFSAADAPEDSSAEEPVSLEEVLQRFRSAGLHLRVRGTPANTLHQADANTERVIMQVIQEALTNALKHGAGTARLELSSDDHTIRCTVQNPVPPSPTERSAAPLADLSGGIGLGSMAAVIDRAGGHFSAGVHADNGAKLWTVDVEVPVKQPTGAATT